MSNQNDTSASIIKRIQSKIKTATKPVTETLHHNKDFQVIMLGLNSGVSLPDQQTKVPEKITVLSGSVTYHDAEDITPLFSGDELDVPVNVTHSVRATERSICLLTRG